VGFKEKLLGITVNVFDINKCINKGIFLALNETNWRIPRKVQIVNQSNEELFYLPFILQKVGWQIIINNLILHHKYEETEIKGSTDEIVMT